MKKLSLNNAWRFHFGEPKDQPNIWENADTDGWRCVDLPHDWSIELPRQATNPSGSAGGFFTMGRGYYERVINVPADWHGKKVFVEFEGVYMNAEVWLDEHFLTRQAYGYTTFRVELTPYLKLGGTNHLRVRVDNSTQLNSRWYSGSGIYRPVWFLLAEPVHLAHWGVSVTTPGVSTQEALVNVCALVENELSYTTEVTIQMQIQSADDQVVATAEEHGRVPRGNRLEFNSNLKVVAPRLWSPDTPNLYHLKTEVLTGGQVVDTEVTPFGIRSLEFSADHGFVLNGQPVKLKGGCVHHDNGVMGAASFTRSEERKVELLKASGFNAVRCAHNPPAPAFLDACDRLGLLVIDEAFDCWRDGKNFFDYHIVFDDWWQRDLDTMLLRDRNHPSIILWSIGNELLERNRPEGAAIARRLAGRVRSINSTRPVTAAICGTWNNENKGWDATDGVFATLDVGGYNYRWKEYGSDNNRLPQRLMIGTESFPLEAFDNWQAVVSQSCVLGDFVWTALDYLGESGIGRVKFDSQEPFLGEYPWHQANCGDIDICGFKRPQSFYRDILWKNGAQFYLAVHYPLPEGKTPKITEWGWPEVWPNWNWPGCEGKVFQVDIYSACEQVELLLNGRSLGRQSTTPAERHIARFDVPYEVGELKAIGFSAGQPAAEIVLKTAGPATQLRLTADRASIQAVTDDLAYVTAEIVDSEGQVHPAADRTIYFAVTGAGELAAVGNGNPISEESYRAHGRTTYRGRCLAVVKSNGQPGQIRLHAQADGLSPAEVVISVE